MMSTRIVVVLIPPPVEAGDAPMNMNMQLPSFEKSDMPSTEMELYPAVRAVTPEKKEFISLPPKSIPPSVAGLSHSARR